MYSLPNHKFLTVSFRKTATFFCLNSTESLWEEWFFPIIPISVFFLGLSGKSIHATLKRSVGDFDQASLWDLYPRWYFISGACSCIFLAHDEALQNWLHVHRVFRNCRKHLSPNYLKLVIIINKLLTEHIGIISPASVSVQNICNCPTEWSLLRKQSFLVVSVRLLWATLGVNQYVLGVSFGTLKS